jgi:hypothetical protein
VSIPAKVVDASAEKALRAILLWLGGILGSVLIAANIIGLLFFGGAALADLAHSRLSAWPSEFKKKAKCAQRSESLPSKLLCNQYNPECGGDTAIRIRAKFPRLLGTKNNREVMSSGATN